MREVRKCLHYPHENKPECYWADQRNQREKTYTARGPENQLCT